MKEKFFNLHRHFNLRFKIKNKLIMELNRSQPLEKLKYMIITLTINNKTTI
jgi:hypothetical protein